MAAKVADTKSFLLDQDPEVDTVLRALIDEALIARPVAARRGGTGVDGFDGAVERLGIKPHANAVGRQNVSLRDTARYVVYRSKPRR